MDLTEALTSLCGPVFTVILKPVCFFCSQNKGYKMIADNVDFFPFLHSYKTINAHFSPP